MSYGGIDDLLDSPGRWTIRVTVYRNDKRVGTCDTADWETYESAAYWVSEGLSTRDIEPHVPRSRSERGS